MEAKLTQSINCKYSCQRVEFLHSIAVVANAVQLREMQLMWYSSGIGLIKKDAGQLETIISSRKQHVAQGYYNL